MSETKEQATVLTPAALTAYRMMFWPGIGLLLVAVFVVILGFGDEYDGGFGEASAFAFAGGTLQLSLILLVGAGVVSGLGRRVEPDEEL